MRKIMKFKYFVKIIFVVVFVSKGLFAQNIDSDASYVFAKKLFNDGMYDLAAEQFHQFAEQNFEHPKAPESLLLAGKSYLHTENYNGAKKELIYLITKYPNIEILDEAHFFLAECFEKNDEIASAAKTYRQVQIFYPKSAFATSALIKSALMYKRLKKYDVAAENLYQLIEFYPFDKKSNEARLLLSDIYVDKKNYKQAILELDKLLNLTEKGIINANAMFKKGHAEFLSDNIQQAEDILFNLTSKYQSQQTEEIENILNKAYYDLAEISQKKGLFNESNEYLKKITNYELNNKFLFKIANNFFSIKNYSSAIEYYEKITESNSDSLYLCEALYKLGKSYTQLQDYVNSNIAYKHVIKIISDRGDEDKKSILKSAYLSISDNYIKKNTPQLAVKYIKDYLKIFNNDQNKDIIVFKICNLYETKINDIERAIRAYYDFIDNYPQSKLIDDAQFNLARCFEKKNEYKQAIIEYNQLITHYPASDYLPSAKKRIQYINNYYQKNDNVLNKFGLMMRQLTGDQPNNLSSFDVGLIYFNELKDYRSAINLFKKHYNRNSDDVDTDKIIYYLGRSYQLLGEKNGIKINSQKIFLDSAYYNYGLLLENFPNSDYADDAAFYQIKLTKLLNKDNNEITNYQTLKNDLINFKYKYNESVFLDRVNIQLGNLLMQSDIRTSVDSMDIHHCFEAVINANLESTLIDQAKFGLAIFYNKIENISETEKKLKDFIENYKESSLICKAYLMLAQLSENKENYDNAIYYLKFIEENFYYSKCSENAKLTIAKLLKKQNKFSEAKQYYKQLYEDKKLNSNYLIYKKEDENDQLILFNLAQVSFINKNNEKAIELFNEYLSKFPKGKYADVVLFNLGKLYSINNSDMQKKAIDYFKHLVKEFPERELADSSILKLGDLNFLMDNYETAIKYYSDFMTKNIEGVDYSFPFSQKIVCLYRLGKIKQADEQFKVFKKKYKAEEHLLANMLLEKGDYYIKTKNLTLAEKIFKKVKSDYKNSHDGAKAEYLLGKLNFILNKDEEALEIMSKLIKRYPEDKILPDVYITLGSFYYLQAKQIENALLSYKKAVEYKNIEESKLKIAMNNLIKCYSDLRLREQAQAVIRKYLNKFPTDENNFEKRVLMGILYYQLNEYDYALTLLKKLKYEADIENEPRIQYWIGECYFGKGEFKKAVSEYLKIVYLSKPTKLNWRVTAQYQAGVASIKAGDPNRAKKIFDKIILEQGADSVFGKPAQKKIDEINYLLKDN